ncbi:hypothetical protein [Bradyrhizobium sp. URHD0069]|uniref:hypothetical protein n=1 Tax=Bradyrhizobium sp. URHD0069 TaxID=1380355 RepID=UPI0004978EC6|nr:hypothetical protein [Bradyrhizobium sp. URHD0069]
MLCDLRPWLLDSLDFMIEQLKSAKSPEDQFAGTDAAMGFIPFLRCRLKEDIYLGAQFTWALHIWVDADHYKSVWVAMADSPPDEFSKAADELIDTLAVLKGIVAAPPTFEKEGAAESGLI